MFKILIYLEITPFGKGDILLTWLFTLTEMLMGKLKLLNATVIHP